MKTILSLSLFGALSASAAVTPAAPDLSAGLSAARAIVLEGGKPVRLASLQEREMLLALLRDPDAGVRRAALKSLRGYVGQTLAARDAVLAVYWNANEEASVRAEAAKTLALVSTYREVYDRLLSYAERGPVASLRVISAKALYLQAAARSDVRQRLERLLLLDASADVRAAAAWSLFAASGNTSTRDALDRSAGRDASNAVRVEAIKSLYGAMGHSSVRYGAVRLALDTRAPAELRKPAILLLSWGGDYQTKQALERLVRTERDPELRAAAIQALNPSDEAIARYFHLARRTQTGAYLDPLENE